jgi:hypothetical protein
VAQIINIATVRDAKITGTTDPAKLGLIVRILSLEIPPFRNNAVQRAKLAAAKRLLRGQA